MNNGNNKEQKVQKVETQEIQEYQVAELVDDALAAGVFSEHMRNQYVYEFKQGNRLIRGLTASAYAHLSIEYQITIAEPPEREIMDKGILYTVCCENKDGLRSYGIAYETFVDHRGEADKFCWQKALTKARRNAQKQLLPATLQASAIETLINLDVVEFDGKNVLPDPEHNPRPTKDTPQPKKSPVKDTPQPKKNGNDPISKEQKRAFDLYEEIKYTLPSNFWDIVRGKYGVESRVLMTIDHWNDLSKFFQEYKEIDDDPVLRNEAINNFVTANTPF